MLFNLAFLQQHYELLTSLYAQSPVGFGLGFFALMLFVTTFSIPVATWLSILAGAIFGFWHGLLIVSFACSIGATLAMLIARYFLSERVERRFGARRSEINAGIAKDGAFYLFAIRLTPFLPYFLVNILFGLTSMEGITFYAVSQLGMLPLNAVYVNAGLQLTMLHSISDIANPLLLGPLALAGVLPLVMRKIIMRS